MGDVYSLKRVFKLETWQTLTRDAAQELVKLLTVEHEEFDLKIKEALDKAKDRELPLKLGRLIHWLNQQLDAAPTEDLELAKRRIFAKALKKLRNNLGMTQAEISLHMGIPRYAVHFIEKVDLKNVEKVKAKILKYFSMTEEEFMSYGQKGDE